MTNQDKDKLQRELAIAQAEIIRLQRLNSHLQFQLDVTPQNNVREQPELPPSMPSPHQLHLLFDLVCNKYPPLRHASGRTDTEHYDAYAASFLALQFVRRVPTLDTSRSNGSWCGLIEDWLVARGRGQSVHTAAFCAAVVACHDIAFTAQDRFTSLFGLGFGLCFAGVAANSRPPTDAWRKLLNGTEVPRAPEPVPGRTLRPDLVGGVVVGGVK